jgi:cholesterol oxidase
VAYPLSRPIEQIRSRYDVVVIGSGYGGSIAASRFARAGRAVCLLERGREILPGDYPATAVEGFKELQYNTPLGHVGARLGLFEIHVNDDMNAVVGCGLGGTSLINANVSLPPDTRLWDDPCWPKPVRDDLPFGLKEGYRLAAEMLQPQPLPDGFPALPKLKALETSAAALGLSDRFYRPPINVTFQNGVNHAGVEQKRCIGCGDCVSGCNHWAKNTTLMNYLPDAARHGAEIYCGARARSVERAGSAWAVRYDVDAVGRDKFDAPELTVTADLVIIAAGTLGSTEILLRSKARGLTMSDTVGERFSANGDVLAFGYGTGQEINGIGWGTHTDGRVKPVGPCITGIIDTREPRDAPNVADGFVIEEGSIPGAVGVLAANILGTAAAGIGHAETPGWKAWLVERLRGLAASFQNAYHGPIHNTQTYLVMAHDDGRGRLALEQDRLRVRWPGVGSQPVFARVNQALDAATGPLGGEYVVDPIWSDQLGKKLVTVHPLGGCVMAEDAGSGVVDHMGRVFARGGGTEVHDGLVVADGAIMPRSLGVNPLLTISAFAERNCALLAKARGWTINYALDAAPVGPAPGPKLGLRFTETMRGYFSTVEKADFAAAEAQARAAGSEMAFTLTVISEDLEAMLTQERHEASMVGTLSCRALSDRPLTVNAGRFNLFVTDPTRIDTRNMVYRMTLAAEDGRSWFFHGVKIIDDSTPLDAWPQTTTLYVTVSESEREGAPVVGKGILHIAPVDFARQLTTVAVTHAPSRDAELKAIARFGKFFAGVLYESYGGLVARETIFNPDAPPRHKRPLRTGPPEVHPFKTRDGVTLRLTRYRGGDKGPVMLIHGAGVSSGIFSTDLIETNLVEYLYAQNYDVWLLDFRVSIDLPCAQLLSNADDVATIDHVDAVETVRRLTCADTIQVVAHCYGATTFTMALLAGLGNVRSVVLSQVSAHLIVKAPGRIKAGLHLPDVLGELGVRDMTAYRDTHGDWRQRLIDDALRLYPIQHGEECRSAVCHRISFLYALLYEHKQLSPELHENLHELFGIANIKLFEHLGLMARRGQVVRADGADDYLPHLDRMRMPIAFIHGANNQCFIPDSTQRTFDLLCAKNGPALYSRTVIPDYGHIDCIFGRNAAIDVYPHITAHLDRTARVN